MSENDKILARRVVEKKRLSSQQAQELLEESDRTGRPFREIALGRGLVAAQDFDLVSPKQVPTAVVLLIFVALMILMGLALMTTTYFQKDSQPPPQQQQEQEQQQRSLK